MCLYSIKELKSGEKKILILKGNIRDYASLNELLVLANMESYNAILIEKGMGQKKQNDRIEKFSKEVADVFRENQL